MTALEFVGAGEYYVAEPREAGSGGVITIESDNS